jgi:hypothetical protein
MIRRTIAENEIIMVFPVPGHNNSLKLIQAPIYIFTNEGSSGHTTSTLIVVMINTTTNNFMPLKTTIKKAKAAKKQGKSPSTQAGEFVHEEIEKIRKGQHGARSAKQAIAIGLSKARRAGVDLEPPKKGTVSEKTRKSAASAYKKGQAHEPVSPKRSAAREKALKKEPKTAASHEALSRQTKAAAKKRTAAERSAAAKKAAKTKGAAGRSKAAKKAARTRST